MDAAVVCPGCGCAVASTPSIEDEPSTGLNILAFLIPILGLILFIVYNGKTPIKAKAIGKWALIGFFSGLILQAAILAM